MKKSELLRLIREEVEYAKKCLMESPASDSHEKKVADGINKMKGIKAERPKVSAAYSDVKLTTNSGGVTWLEVKMNHTDNLSNPRVFFDGSKWDTTYHTPAATFAVKQLNASSEAKDFLKSLRKFMGVGGTKKIKLPTTKSGLSDPDAVSLKTMKAYFEQPGITRYILKKPGVNLGKLVTDHYTKGKAEPAYYMQAGDDFYLISNTNPFNLPAGIPVLKGTGEFKIRIATRSAFYEIQAEIKIVDMPTSSYSALKGSKKKNPFANLKEAKNPSTELKTRINELAGLSKSKIGDKNNGHR